jgi:hypothetical protein
MSLQCSVRAVQVVLAGAILLSHGMAQAQNRIVIASINLLDLSISSKLSHDFTII